MQIFGHKLALQKNNPDKYDVVTYGAPVTIGLSPFRDGKVELSEGEMYVVPNGVEHKPYAEKECHIMLIEPRGVVNTGEVKNNLTAINDNWI